MRDINVSPTSAVRPAAPTNQDLAGFTTRLRERGHEVAFIEQGDYSYESGYAAANRLLDAPTGRMRSSCANDMMAMAAIDVARIDLGLRVPEDVSIIGFDDNESASWPKEDHSTTVQQPVDQHGTRHH